MMTSVRFSWALPVLAAFILLGFGLRLYQLNRFALRGDEAFTVIHWMREPLGETLANIATVDPQPPLAYGLYRAYALVVGSQEHIVRFLPALLNTLGIPALYALGVRMGGRRVGLSAALLFAVHPLQIWHAQDARNYAVWGAFSPIALWLALRAVYRRRRVDWVLYVFAAAAACYVYYLELFTVVALNIYVVVFYRRDRRLLVQWLVSQAVIFLLLAPWFFQPRLLSGGGYGGTAVGFQLELLWLWFLPVLMFGESFDLNYFYVPLFLLFFFASFVFLRFRRWFVFLVLLVVLPSLLLSLVATRLDVFTPRYVLSLTVPFVLVVAFAFVVSQRSFGFLRFVSLVVFFVALFLSFLSYFGLSVFHNDYAKSPDWRSVTAFLREHTSSEDIIVQQAADEAFTFYHGEYGIPAAQIRLPANPDQAPSEIQTILANRLDAHHSLWLVTDPPTDWDNRDVPLTWLNGDAQLVLDTRVSSIPVRQYMPWEVRPDELAPDELARFGSTAALLGARVTAAAPDGTLTVWLYWQPLANTQHPLKVFLHLIGGINPASGTPLWSQDDQFPQDGRLNTTAWSSAEVYRDIYALPVRDLPAGSYQLVAGWYDPETNRRLLVDDTDADFYPLQTLTLP
jgi:hypothetical protein